jgi:uncharacterized protein YcnI
MPGVVLETDTETVQLDATVQSALPLPGDRETAGCAGTRRVFGNRCHLTDDYLSCPVSSSMSRGVSMLRTLQRAGVVLAVVFAGLVVAAPAWAHVTVSSPSAVQGGYAKLTFRVPNEKDAASTTRLEVHFPTDTPLASVSVKPVSGWTAKVTSGKLPAPVKIGDREITEAVTTIVWTAGAGTAIKPGEFQEFDVSGGPLPEADQLVFKALQVYSDGEIVRWIEEPQAGQAEPEHPAPVLKLAKAGESNGGVQVSATPVAVASPAPSNGTAMAALIIGILALAAAGAALVLGVLGRRRPSP